ncbi:MAG: hypothetical protein IAE78_06005 [Myxococcus sp.]|nr:hypothetical protein [Myxococcus sp.]
MSLVKSVVVVFGALCVAGCDSSAAPPGKLVTYPARPRVDLSASGLPTLANGNTLLVEVPRARLEHDGRLKDSLTALGACVDEVIGCVSPDERSLDDCFRSVRACSTPTPWNEAAPCCPSACLEGYAAERAAGKADFEAFRQTLFVEKTCMPGLTDLLARGRR